MNLRGLCATPCISVPFTKTSEAITICSIPKTDEYIVLTLMLEVTIFFLERSTSFRHLNSVHPYLRSASSVKIDIIWANGGMTSPKALSDSNTSLGVIPVKAGAGERMQVVAAASQTPMKGRRAAMRGLCSGHPSNVIAWWVYGSSPDPSELLFPRMSWKWHSW